MSFIVTLPYTDEVEFKEKKQAYKYLKLHGFTYLYTDNNGIPAEIFYYSSEVNKSDDLCYQLELEEYVRNYDNDNVATLEEYNE